MVVKEVYDNAQQRIEVLTRELEKERTSNIVLSNKIYDAIHELHEVSMVLLECNVAIGDKELLATLNDEQITYVKDKVNDIVSMLKRKGE